MKDWIKELIRGVTILIICIAVGVVYTIGCSSFKVYSKKGFSKKCNIAFTVMSLYDGSKDRSGAVVAINKCIDSVDKDEKDKRKEEEKKHRCEIIDKCMKKVYGDKFDSTDYKKYKIFQDCKKEYGLKE